MTRLGYTALIALLLATTLTASAGASRMPSPPHVTIHEGTPCPDGGGSCSYSHTDDVFLEAGADAFEREHELGHQFDRQVLTDAYREWFTKRLGFQPGPWDRGTGLDCGGCGPDEHFADAYAACATGMKPVGRRRGGIQVSRWTTSYGYYPTARQHRRVCNAIVVVGLIDEHERKTHQYLPSVV